MYIINGDQLNGEQAREVYEAVSGTLDEDGYKLFDAAQDILGKFSYSHFAYEDNLGYFEEADGFTMLRYLLVQYDYLLGKANDRPGRWEIACSCYEKCIDFSIDETTPEYKDFESKLYICVLEKMEIVKS